jgi:hypothetical protein
MPKNNKKSEIEKFTPTPTKMSKKRELDCIVSAIKYSKYDDS